MIKVINKHDPDVKTVGECAYVGRGTPLGNPFGVNIYAQILVDSRREALDKYRGWILESIRTRNAAVCGELNRLYKIARDGDLTLVCSCKPLGCHADIIKEILEEKLNDRNSSKIKK